jgi:hypothetical protein
MHRKLLTGALALALGSSILPLSSALAQPVGGTTTQQPTGISKPPPGTSPAGPKRLDQSNSSILGNNTPTTPQIALHPTATIGSPVPIAGPGGTTRNATGD